MSKSIVRREFGDFGPFHENLLSTKVDKVLLSEVTNNLQFIKDSLLQKKFKKIFFTVGSVFNFPIVLYHACFCKHFNFLC